MMLDRELQTPDATLRFHDGGGDGLPVIFTHGAGMDHTTFRAQAQAVLEAGYRPILWDQRGHGESSLDVGVRFSASDALDDLRAIIAEAGADKAVLVGHSLGGNLSQDFVRQHPERVAGLVVIDSTWNAGALTGLERFLLKLAAPSLRLIPAGRLPRLMAQASAAQPDAVDEIEQIFARMPKGVFLDVWRAVVSFVRPDAEYRTPVPLGLIRGAEDRTGNIAAAMAAWAAAEGVHERVIPDAGHVVMLDAPEPTNEALLSILADISG